MLPKDFPPFTTVQGYFYDWRDDGLFEKINFALLLEAREAAGREASPSAGWSIARVAGLPTLAEFVVIKTCAFLGDWSPSCPGSDLAGGA
jgi:transposase